MNKVDIEYVHDQLTIFLYEYEFIVKENHDQIYHRYINSIALMKALKLCFEAPTQTQQDYLVSLNEETIDFFLVQNPNISIQTFKKMLLKICEPTASFAGIDECLKDLFFFPEAPPVDLELSGKEADGKESKSRLWLPDESKRPAAQELYTYLFWHLDDAIRKKKCTKS